MFEKVFDKLKGFKVIDKLVNYSHTSIATAYATSVLVYHLKTGHDLGPNFISFTYAFFGFLLGHAGVYQKWPDQPSNGI
jgi:hypothetical protein